MARLDHEVRLVVDGASDGPGHFEAVRPAARTPGASAAIAPPGPRTLSSWSIRVMAIPSVFRKRIVDEPNASVYVELPDSMTRNP